MNRASPTSDERKLAGVGFWLLISLIALVPVVKAFLYDTLDPDSFIHLQAADQMSREGVGPIVDSQSYMSIREPWTPYSWLGEFAMKFIWDHGGYQAAIACHAFMAAGLVFLYALGCKTRISGEQGLMRVVLATAFAAYLSIPYLSFRPVTAALVVMAVIVWLLVRDRMAGERSSAVWLAIPLTILLINLHLYAIIIPAWVFALWAGAAWERSRRGMLRYGALLIGTILACLATPMLPGAIKSMAFYQATDPIVASSVVKEYLPFYQGPAGIVGAGLVVIALGCAVVRRRQLRAGEVFWLLGSIVFLLRMGRFAPVYAMVAGPIFAATLLPFSDRILSRRLTRIAVAGVVGAGLVRVVMAIPMPSVTLDQWLERNGPYMPGYPAAAAAYVEAYIPPRTGRIINEYTWGGYLSWRLGPRFKVLLDGRTNLYTPEFWKKAYLSSENEQAEFLTTIDADVAVLPSHGNRFETALMSRGWKIVYADARAMVLAPGTSSQ